MRLYTPFSGPSTPFVLFFLKKAKIFLTFQINPLKTVGYELKIFSTFFGNTWFFIDVAERSGWMEPIFPTLLPFFCLNLNT